MDISDEVFRDLNHLYYSPKSNKDKARGLRDLIEKILQNKLSYDGQNHVPLKKMYLEYYRLFKPEEIRYTGERLIEDLNPWSHFKKDELSDNDLEILFQKFLKVTESIYQTKSPYKLINENVEIDFLKELKLNEEQKYAVHSSDRITLVKAGPGTGKTHLIIGRLINSLSSEDTRKIVALSFTNKAADVLNKTFKIRLAAICKEDQAISVPIGTIHSFTYTTIKNYYKSILDEDYLYKIIDEEELNEIKQGFVNNDILIKKYLEDNKLLTFDSLLLVFKDLLFENSTFQTYINNTIKELIIDEAQDLSKLQYKIFEKLFEVSDNLKLFFVGDPRQNIFNFLGGRYENLTETFGESQIREINLLKCYRCPQNILNFVNTFDFKDCKNLSLSSDNNNDQELISFNTFRDKNFEANWILNKIKEYQNEGKLLKDMAILSPSSFYFGELANSLNKDNIPFKLFGGETIMIKQIRFFINILRSIFEPNKHFIYRVILFFDSKIQVIPNDFNSTIDNIKGSNYEGQIKNILNFIGDHFEYKDGLISLSYKILDFLSSGSYFDKEYLDLFKKLIEGLKDMEMDKFEEFITNISPNSELLADFYIKNSNIECSSEVKDNFISLSTIHSAKGGEWPVIFIPGLTQNLFPVYNSVNYNDELKKFYVACTRSSEKLHFTRPIQYSVKKKMAYGTYSFNNEISSFFNLKNKPFVIFQN
jgi:DNA helicase-2/ATP-dependent DNA helicase PcrA